MAIETGIEWAHSTFNPWIGCTEVGPGCDNCYARTLMQDRWHKVEWGAGKPRLHTSAANWRAPLAWEKKAAASGQPWRVFCASLADVFDHEVPAHWREDLFDLIRKTPHLTWLLLTKRAPNVRRMLPADWGKGWPNVWLGVTAVNGQELQRDFGTICHIPAVVRWVSAEPLLGPMHHELKQFFGLYEPEEGRYALKVGSRWADSPDWIILGGESGSLRRPLDLGECRVVRDECAAADVPLFFKQVDKVLPIPDDLLIRQFPV